MTSTPWLEDMLADIGVHEVDGPLANPKIVAYFSEVGHPECKSDEIAWCAARVGAALRRAGKPIPPVSVNLMARSYCTYGVACEPKPGAIVVFPRGDSTWQGHVGCVVSVLPGQRVKFVAGNQSDQVGYGEADIAHALCFRWPIEATVKALRKAGSTEIASADNIQKVAIAASGTAATAAAAAPDAPPPVLPAIPHEAQSAFEYVSFAQQAQEGFRAVAELVHSYWWVGVLMACGAAWLVARWWKQRRVERAEAGQPLSSQIEE